MSIDPVEFGELKGMVQATLANTEKINEKFDTKLDDHGERITVLETTKKTEDKERSKVYVKAGFFGAITGGVVTFLKAVFT